MKKNNGNHFFDAPAKRVCTVAQVRAIEQELFRSQKPYAVMTAAGKHVAQCCQKIARNTVLVAGTGNNGGDAYVAATALLAKNGNADVWAPLGKPATVDAKRAAREFAQAGGKVLAGTPQWEQYGCVVDGLFGIGLGRDLTGDALDAVKAINSAGKPIVAIDISSGLCADTATVRGDAVRALITVTFFCIKPGLLMGAGKELAGEVRVAKLGDDKLVTNQGGTVIDRPCGHEILRRNADSHKGSYGTLALIGGAIGMTGALALASRAAVAHGAGKVFVVALGSDAPAFDMLAPEVMWRTEIPEDSDVCSFGVGAGVGADAYNLLSTVVKRKSPQIIDADGLNLLAKNPKLRNALGKFAIDPILTPHPAEAGRLLDITTTAIQADRVACAQKLAAKAGAVVVLKGSGTVIADSKGVWGIVAAGNPGLAQAGSGDVLTGIIGALRAQGMSAWDAAVTGAWLHAKAADLICEERGGQLGLPLAQVCARSAQLLANLVCT